MNTPVTIKLYLVDGAPDELRTAEISNWSGKAIAGSRRNLGDLLQREELAGSGIYLLIGRDDDNQPKLYIGEAEVVHKRLSSKQHANRDFWVSVIVFVSKDQNLTKAHIKYLEGKLIDKGRALELGLENGQSSGASLPESDAADMDSYLEKMYQLLPVLGVRFFEDPRRDADDSDVWLFCKIKGLEAKGRRTASGFVIVEGSQAVLKHRPSAKRVVKVRDKLINRGVLSYSGDHMVFTKDYEFSSPSAAGCVVRGGGTNGLTAWKNERGISLKELEAI